MAPPDMEHRVSQLRHDVDDVYALLDQTNRNVEATNQMVANIAAEQQRHGIRLDALQATLDGVTSWQDRTDGRLDRTDSRLDRLEQSHQRLEDSHQRLVDSHQRLEDSHQRQDAKLDAILAALHVRPSDGVPRPAQEASGA